MLGFVRTNKVWCGRVALFALALQLYLSFGHIHAEDLGIVQPAGITTANAPGSHDSAAPNSKHDDEHDICAICITLGLTGSSSIPFVESLTLPIASDFRWLVPTISPQLDFPLAANFRARAPPHA